MQCSILSWTVDEDEGGGVDQATLSVLEHVDPGDLARLVANDQQWIDGPGRGYSLDAGNDFAELAAQAGEAMPFRNGGGASGSSDCARLPAASSSMAEARTHIGIALLGFGSGIFM